MLRYVGSRTAGLCRGALLRQFSTVIDAQSDAEKQIAAKIQEGLTAQSIKVQDTSGGCGVSNKQDAGSATSRSIAVHNITEVCSLFQAAFCFCLVIIPA